MRYIILTVVLLIQCSVSCAQDLVGSDGGAVKAMEQDSYIVKDGQFNREFPPKIEVVKNFDIPKCIDAPLHFSKCIKGLCYDSAAFGDIYRKILGEAEDGHCQYVERTIGYGDMECLFPSESLGRVGDLFDKSYTHFYSEQKKMSDVEIKSFSNLVSQHCRMKSLPLDSDILAIRELEDSNTFFLDVVRPAPHIKQDEVMEEEVESVKSKDVLKDPDQYQQSVMFSGTQLQAIVRAVKRFNQGSGIKGQGDSDDSFSLTSFYLNSILYLSENRWIVWINNHKIGIDNAHPFLSIVEVGDGYVKVRWATAELDSISPDWKDLLIYKGRGLYESQDFDIKIEPGKDKNLNIIIFKLLPNQTFDPRTFEIFEGKLR